MSTHLTNCNQRSAQRPPLLNTSIDGKVLHTISSQTWMVEQLCTGCALCTSFSKEGITQPAIDSTVTMGQKGVCGVLVRKGQKSLGYTFQSLYILGGPDSKQWTFVWNHLIKFISPIYGDQNFTHLLMVGIPRKLGWVCLLRGLIYTLVFFLCLQPCLHVLTRVTLIRINPDQNPDQNPD